MATETSHPERERRAAKNESLFLELNEQEIEDNGNGLWLTLVCECAEEACAEGIELTPEEYEAVRRNRPSSRWLRGTRLPRWSALLRSTSGTGL
jgi:hypothetical protein